MDNFDDVEQEVMMHDADDVSAVVRELVEMNSDDVNEFPIRLLAKVMIMRAAFNYWKDVIYEKSQQKRPVHLYGQEDE